MYTYPHHHGTVELRSQDGPLIYSKTLVDQETQVAEITTFSDDGAVELANARLIAAAPELLEAVKAIKARIKGEWDAPALVKQGPLTCSKDVDIERFVDHAIAKAEGKV